MLSLVRSTCLGTGGFLQVGLRMLLCLTIVSYLISKHAFAEDSGAVAQLNKDSARTVCGRGYYRDGRECLPNLGPNSESGALANSTVLAAQRMLLELGYDVGEIDGIAGPKTRYAIESSHKEVWRNRMALEFRQKLHKALHTCEPARTDAESATVSTKCNVVFQRWIGLVLR